MKSEFPPESEQQTERCSSWSNLLVIGSWPTCVSVCVFARFYLRQQQQQAWAVVRSHCLTNQRQERRPNVVLLLFLLIYKLSDAPWHEGEAHQEDVKPKQHRRHRALECAVTICLLCRHFTCTESVLLIECFQTKCRQRRTWRTNTNNTKHEHKRTDIFVSVR